MFHFYFQLLVTSKNYLGLTNFRECIKTEDPDEWKVRDSAR